MYFLERTYLYKQELDWSHKYKAKNDGVRPIHATARFETLIEKLNILGSQIL